MQNQINIPKDLPVIIKTGNLAEGYYLLTLQTKEKIYRGKFMVVGK